MATPKNTKVLKTPLSTVKKGPIKGLRNILANPYEFSWPVVKEEKSEELRDILITVLPKKKKEPREISWAQLRKMPKEERAALKQSKKIEKKTNAINGICLGVNQVTRALEKNLLSSVLLDSTVEPLLLVKHVVTMSRNKNVPVILVPFLKTSTAQNLGFASAALGVNTSSIKDDSPHLKLHEKLSELSKDFPSIQGPVHLFSDENSESEDPEEPEVSRQKISRENPEQFKLSKSVYLHRKSVADRAFIPPDSQISPKPEETSWTEFISLGKNFPMQKFAEIKKMKRYIDVGKTPKISKKLKKKCRKISPMEIDDAKVEDGDKKIEAIIYRPLKVKRVQGNVERIKATKTPKIKKKSSAGKKVKS